MKLSVDYWLDPKFQGLGTTHEAFYVRLLGYTRKWDTDGFIPASAIALCGRRIYNRDKVLADLVKAGLLEPSPDDSSALVFPKSWAKYSMKHDASKHQSAGQGGSSREGGVVKRSREKKDLDLAISNTPRARGSDNGNADSERWAAIMADLSGSKPVLIDGQLCTRQGSDWIPINGKAR